jgi:GNAT superfamily N-acetyltransferase
MVIRKAERRDIDALGRLGAMMIRVHHDFDKDRFLAPMEGTERGYGAFLVSRIDTPESCVYVADDNGVVVGYVFAALEPMSWMELRKAGGVIHDVLVLESARGGGVGTKLMQTALAWLREHGAGQIILMTAAKNATAHALFRRLGFRDTMTEMTLDL